MLLFCVFFLLMTHRTLKTWYPILNMWLCWRCHSFHCILSHCLSQFWNLPASVFNQIVSMFSEAFLSRFRHWGCFIFVRPSIDHASAECQSQRISQLWALGIPEHSDIPVKNLSLTPLGLLFTRGFQFSRLFENPSPFAPHSENHDMNASSGKTNCWMMQQHICSNKKSLLFLCIFSFVFLAAWSEYKAFVIMLL